MHSFFFRHAADAVGAGADGPGDRGARRAHPLHREERQLPHPRHRQAATHPRPQQGRPHLEVSERVRRA